MEISEYGDEEGLGKEIEDWLKKQKENKLMQHNRKLGEGFVKNLVGNKIHYLREIKENDDREKATAFKKGLLLESLET